MAYGQWAESAITSKPMYNMNEYIKASPYADESNVSYRRVYQNTTFLMSADPTNHTDFTPEVSYYELKSGLTGTLKEVNYTDIFANMDDDHLFN